MQKGTTHCKHHMPVTHCFLLSRPLQAFFFVVMVAGSEGENPPLNATRLLMVKSLPDQRKGRHWREEATQSSLKAVLRTVSACGMCRICLSLCTFLCMYASCHQCGWTWLYCIYVLVVCHSTREWPQFIYTKLSRGGTVSVSVSGEAGVLAIPGFQWLTPKLFIFQCS